VLRSITDSIDAFTAHASADDYDDLPPYLSFLAYKAALIITSRLVAGDNSGGEVDMLRPLRSFLRMLGQRWRSGGKQTDHDGGPMLTGCLSTVP
jgi:hypothetical protein